jgi:class 3 adenylate cyclase
VNLAARLANAARPHEILATVDLAGFAADDVPVESAGMITVAGIHEPVEVVRFGCAAAGDTVRA